MMEKKKKKEKRSKSKICASIIFSLLVKGNTHTQYRVHNFEMKSQFTPTYLFKVRGVIIPRPP